MISFALRIQDTTSKRGFFASLVREMQTKKFLHMPSMEFDVSIGRSFTRRDLYKNSFESKRKISALIFGSIVT
jgi:hypothetical protein